MNIQADGSQIKTQHLNKLFLREPLVYLDSDDPGSFFTPLIHNTPNTGNSIASVNPPNTKANFLLCLWHATCIFKRLKNEQEITRERN